MKRSNRILSLFLGYWLLLIGPANATPIPWTQEIKMGMSPWTSGNVLQEWVTPFAEWVKEETGLPIIVSSSGTFEQYLLDGIAGQYDFMQVPVHMGLYLIDHHGFEGIMVLRAQVNVYALATEKSGIRSLKGLAGKTVLLPDPLTYSAMYAQEKLQSVDKVRVRFAHNHWGVLNELIQQTADAGFMVSVLYQGLNRDMKARFRVLHRSPLVLDTLYVVPPGTKDYQKILLQKNMTKVRPNKGLVVRQIDVLSSDELGYWRRKMQPYVQQLEHLMAPSLIENRQGPAVAAP